MSRPSRPKGKPLPPSTQVLAIVQQGGSTLASAISRLAPDLNKRERNAALRVAIRSFAAGHDDRPVAALLSALALNGADASVEAAAKLVESRLGDES